MYGVLTIPVKEGKYPAILKVPGAGVKPMPAYGYMPNDKAVVLQLGINGIPVNMPREVYNSLDRGALRGYNRFGVDDRNNYYYKRVYIGCARAVDFLAELDCVDAEKIAVSGVSQGGALSFTTAVLNPKVKCLYANYPALCDLTGYLNGRGGGWPHFFRGENDANIKDVKAIVDNLKYFDVVNFARKVKVPVKVAFGYNDTTCCPTSIFSAINVVTSPIELLIYNEIGHYTYPELEKDHGRWILEQLNK
jgi:cephalosporin-C deacetylase-like acetyl esterase